MRVALLLVALTPMFAQANSPEELTAELNVFRAQAGLPLLTTDPALCTTCQTWSMHLSSTGRFYHGGGEHVIARGQSSAREVVRDWLNSPGHRAWLMSSTSTSVGWGVSTDARGQYTWAGAFNGSCGSAGCSTTTRERTTFRQRVFSRR